MVKMSLLFLPDFLLCVYVFLLIFVLYLPVKDSKCTSIAIFACIKEYACAF